MPVPQVNQTSLFDGPDIEPADEIRLTGQLERVHAVLECGRRNGRWYTLAEIQDLTRRWYGLGRRDSEAGISARIRDLRKARFGGHTILRQRRTQGCWEYFMED